ncbi:alpha/beta hydrolase [Rhodococcus fascians]|nr:alpha/beta hydrolase [Rhodococcus fascians]MBY3824212.1 alpha/beta hydrolase [Rhodococcus fascians]MBY3834734.1 alpha/beta hydrolase [Rhodococcus fascians]MBY3863946.1 alpha/beta hydrolase [Rhodococcus fascians]MBY3883417.1 alpha/beta hydrolase [Rhodococcus fascians]
MNSTREPDSARGQAARARRPVRFGGLRTAAGVVAAVIGLLISYLALGNLVPAGESVFTLAPTYVWANFAPQLVVVSLLGVLLCVPLWLARHRPVLRGTASVLVIIGLVASVTITASLLTAASREGGSVNLARALTLSSPLRAPDEIATYVTVDGQPQEARIHVPDSGADGAPVLMYIHGGGWYMGAAATDDKTASWYASQGWYVVNVDYRLSGADYPTWDKAPQDVACALSWTAQKAGLAGADTDRLTVMGDSAGGHLAMLLGWSSAAGAAVSSCPEAGGVPVPDAVVAGYPVGDLTYTYDNGAAPLGIGPKDFTRDFLGGTPAEQPERLAAVSPSTYIGPSAPPTLVLQPERDDFIPAEGNYRLVEQAQDAGAEVTLADVPFAYHGFDSFQGSIGGQLRNTVIRHWLQEQNLAP